jgi:putative ABC transport system permease protein
MSRGQRPRRRQAQLSPALARLILVDSRNAWVRLVGVTAGVAIGVTLFLLLFGAYGALSDRQDRSSWLWLANGSYAADTEVSAPLADDEVLALRADDRHTDAVITRLSVAASENSTVTIPGLAKAPMAGEFYASPALIALMDRTPSDQLAGRYGTLVGSLPNTVLASPNSLVAVTGMDAAAILNASDGRIVSEFTASPYAGNQNYLFVTIIGGIAVLLPVLLLVGIVTKLGAAERRDRFATLRLIGATPRTVAALAAWETAIVSLAGGLLGVLLALVFRPVAALVSIDDGTFFVSDLRVSPLITVVVVAVTTAGATLVAAWSIRRADIGPLGATRQQHEKRPRALRLVPLGLGVAIMTMTSAGAQLGVLPGGEGQLLIGGFLLTSLGLIIAGPYLVWRAGTLISRRVTSAAGVVAVNRIRRAPAATFRSVSGLVVAIFMVTVFAAAATTAGVQIGVRETPGLLPVTSLSARVSQAPAPESISTAVQRLESTAGVTQVTVGFSSGVDGSADAVRSVIRSSQAGALGFTAVPESDFVAFDTYSFTNPGGVPAELSVVTISDLDGFYPSTIYVQTLGSPSDIERARTALVTSGVVAPGSTPGTRADAAGVYLQSMVSSFATLAYLGVGVAMFVSAISLAVATLAAVLDRQRVLGLLRLMGMPVATLRRIITYETAAPLLAVVLLCIGLGFLTAYLILSGLTAGDRTVGLPDSRYFLALLASLLLAGAAVGSTFGSIRKNTAISSTRFE